jgi:voltage-gated potassium channel
MSTSDRDQRNDRATFMPAASGSDGRAPGLGMHGLSGPAAQRREAARRSMTRAEMARYALLRRQRRERDLRAFSLRLALLLSVLLLIVVGGSVAYALTEHSSFAYGFLWTMDTVSTLGSLPVPQNLTGRVLLVLLELFGIGILFYALATVAEFFVSGQLAGILQRRRSEKLVASYSDHYIICGYGRVGRQAARELSTAGATVVVIDDNPANQDLAQLAGHEFVEGRASDDDTLLAAGINRAAAIITCVDSDAENIFVTLSARELNQSLTIIARASADDVEKKLVRAGADRVISPYRTTGSAMARIALRPQVEGAVEMTDFRVEQIEAPGACTGVGKSVADVRGNAVIVALRHADGTLEQQPSPHAQILAGDTLIALGTPQQLVTLENLFQPEAALH